MKRFVFSLVVALLAAAQAQAHFVWLALESGEVGKSVAKVYFAELAETDDAALLDRIAHLQVWTRDASGKTSTQPLKLTKQVDQDGGGSWVAEVPAGVEALSGTIKYGVLERGDNVFQLNYHASYADASSPNFAKQGVDASLPMQVLPHLAGEKSQLEVLWKGKPIEGSEVTVVDPAGKEHDPLKTDENGKVTFDLSKPGLYSIRAKWVVDEKGQEGDKSFEKANHYSTLTLRVK
jgi:uncharacterized GH25 family protein